MYQVSILFAGVWYGVGPNYTSERQAWEAINTWRLEQQCPFAMCFRVDKLSIENQGHEPKDLPEPDYSGFLATDDPADREGWSGQDILDREG